MTHWAETAGRAAYRHFVAYLRPPYPDPAPDWPDLSEDARLLWQQLAAETARAADAAAAADRWDALRKDLVAWIAVGDASQPFMVGAKNAAWAKQRAKFARTALDRMDELEHGRTIC